MLISENKRIRRSFSTIPQALKYPSLIQLQEQSYRRFLQNDTDPHKREPIGLHGAFLSVFPIEDFDHTASLEFDHYVLDAPKYEVNECRQRGMTYAAPLRITVRLLVYDVDEATGTRSIRDIKEQEVYLGEVPLMTESGSFIINGIERVVVSQLHRSPGVIFTHDRGKTHSSGKILYSARIIPHRGSWLDFDFDHKDLLWVRIDRKRKLPVTVLLKAIGMSIEEILNLFYNQEIIEIEKTGVKKAKFYRKINFSILAGQRAEQDILDEEGNVLVKKNRKFTKKVIEQLKTAHLKRMLLKREQLIGRVSAKDHVDQDTGEVYLEAGEEITLSKFQELVEKEVSKIYLIYTDLFAHGSFIIDTLKVDKTYSPEEAVIEIYKRLRPGDPPTLEAAQVLFESLFFRPEKYDLSPVGRLKLNYKFPENKIDSKCMTLVKKDICSTLYYLCELNNGRGQVDDIDHLGNRRVRSVGELVENQFRLGLVRMERAVKERMSIQEIDTLMPHDLINQKPVSAVLKEFFGSSQLSQFMEQTNPISELTHKRRLSALGPGGLTRERAGFEVRDVHSTHYGRICPIETPEGPNIGLIVSLPTYAHVNEYGFIETPYRIVKDKKITDEVRYFTATEEENKVIAQITPKYLKKGVIEDEFITARKHGEFSMVQAEEVNLMDVSPGQLVSLATSLIPFLEHDDANRALMGSNMQRQTVPLVKPKAPFVGTGMGKVVARGSHYVVIAKHNGEVTMLDGSKIVVKRDDGGQGESGPVDIYHLTKYRRSNQNTCINQRPIVRVGQRIKKGDVLADGPATDTGELALGQNVFVAFMPWCGYNYEDAILISERLLKDDVYTSVHIEEFECIARDTKLGKEEVTRDIPNVGEEILQDLDESGIVRIGADVKSGDLLVGKVTPKGETQLSPEEKLLRAIFGEKAADVRDTSLRVPPGVKGVVIDAQVFAREGTPKDERSKLILEEQITRIRRDEQIELNAIRQAVLDQIVKLLKGQRTTGKLLSEDGAEELLSEGVLLNREMLLRVPFELLGFIPIEESLEAELSELTKQVQEKTEAVRYVFKEKIQKLKKGDELPPGVIKIVKVQIAIKRVLRVGDKMAGRHGNKGVISKMLPVEDMPYLADGTSVDMVLNPLGVPSRMNLGQLLELSLGWAAKGLAEKIEQYLKEMNVDSIRQTMEKIYDSKAVHDYLEKANREEVLEMARFLSKGVHFATPVFDGAKETDIENMLELADLPKDGRCMLFDGRTGEIFSEPVTVGVMYVLKLHHLVEDKIHARSIGPYSLVTQQPLGGKAQFGGQRLGEMEVWALEAYGAAHCLQEFLTVKSDDVSGRNRIYESIVKGEFLLESGLPESFNVLIKELQSLALNVELLEEEEDDREGLS